MADGIDGPRPEKDPLEEASPADEPLRHPWVWLVYLVLFAASVPWYFPAAHRPSIWLGLPDWVAASLAATAAIAAWTGLVIARYWKDDEP